MKEERGECVLEPLVQRGEAPCDRFKHACVWYDGYVYIHGGRQDFTLGDFWRYSIALNQWEPLPGSPDKLEGHSMVAHDGGLYVFGGMIDSGSNKDVTPLWIYRIDPRKWYHVGKKPEVKDVQPRNRKGHSAVIYQTCMYMYGGYFDLSGDVGEFWAFYFDAGKWSALSARRQGLGPGPRHGHSCTTHNAAMYLFGGLKHMSEQNDFWRFDFRRHNWTNIRSSSGPPKLIGHTVIIHHGCLWVIGGGLASRSPTSNLWKYHFTSRTWKRVSAGKASAQHAKMYHALIGATPEHKDSQSSDETLCKNKVEPLSFFYRKGGNKVGSISTGDLLEMEPVGANPSTAVFCACSSSDRVDDQHLLNSFDNETFMGETEDAESAGTRRIKEDAESAGTRRIKEDAESAGTWRIKEDAESAGTWRIKEDAESAGTRRIKEDLDSCLMFGGKPLSSPSSPISVWRLHLM